MTDPDHETPPAEEPPPILGSWRNIYLLLAGSLVVQIALYWWLTEAYR